jgi:hypothetical protein
MRDPEAPIQQSTKVEMFLNLETAKRSASPSSRCLYPAAPTRCSNSDAFAAAR